MFTFPKLVEVPEEDPPFFGIEFPFLHSLSFFYYSLPI